VERAEKNMKKKITVLALSAIAGSVKEVSPGCSGVRPPWMKAESSFNILQHHRSKAQALLFYVIYRPLSWVLFFSSIEVKRLYATVR